MVASNDTKPNKTAFITAVLEKNPKANPAAVNDAWTKAGHSGTVSTTLVSKLRRELGLTRNARRRGRSAVESNGVKSHKSKAHGTASPATSIRPAMVRSSREDRNRILDEVEAGIDHLIFVLKSSVDMPEVEAALRAARRMLTLGHGE